MPTAIMAAIASMRALPAFCSCSMRGSELTMSSQERSRLWSSRCAPSSDGPISVMRPGAPSFGASFFAPPARCPSP